MMTQNYTRKSNGNVFSEKPDRCKSSPETKTCKLIDCTVLLLLISRVKYENRKKLRAKDKFLEPNQEKCILHRSCEV